MHAASAAKAFHVTKGQGQVNVSGAPGGMSRRIQRP
ncbi:uncharacterized protein METZ01_LOCUS326095, partial [marine metagenome]